MPDRDMPIHNKTCMVLQF